MSMSSCPGCGQANRPGARFCRICGAALEWACVRCSALNRPAAAFCAQCGMKREMWLLQNRYLVTSALGQGGMGAVYLAEDMQLFNRRCVVKEMLVGHLSPADRAEAKRNFQREAALLAALRHPSIPQIYDYFVDANRYFLVMEYVEGESLAARVARGGPLLENELLCYAVQICDVLTYLVNQRPPVVHRDVKPANILLRGDPAQAVLVDFGVAKPKVGRATDTSAWGTQGYAAPEQVAGRAEPRSDVYALAASLYHLLTGDDPAGRPFTFPRLGQLSPVLQALLGRALALNPQGRPDAAELKGALAKLIGAEVSSALRLLEAGIYSGFDRATEKPSGLPVRRFRSTDFALYICLHLANRDLARPHEHRLFVQFYSPDGQLYRVRQRREPVAVAAGQSEVHASVFGLRISGTEVVNHLGAWRAVVYLDEQKMIELHFEIVR